MKFVVVFYRLRSTFCRNWKCYLQTIPALSKKVTGAFLCASIGIQAAVLAMNNALEYIYYLWSCAWAFCYTSGDIVCFLASFHDWITVTSPTWDCHMQLTAVGHCSASNARAAEACWQCPLFTPSVVQLYQRPDDQNGVYIRTSDFAFQRHKLFQPGKPSVWKLEASQRYFFAHVSIFRQACTARAEKAPLLYLALAPGFSDRPLFQEMMMGWGKGTMVLGCWGCWVYFCTCRSVYV